ncbi:MAG TPA: outer membrane lipoprotein carrier protein LolA [Candidatus Hydrogenedentes bacterium]|nr:outer membrane lipoprotein carrier protein LolA [Candidatus Hydrogenedentota bacterium]
MTMKRGKSMIGALAALFFVQAACAEPLDDFFAEFVAKREKIASVQAHFEQKNISPDETISTTGRIAFSKPKQLLFEYFDPKIIYAISDRRAYQYEEELEQVQVYDVESSAQADAFFIAFDNDPSRLRETYNVTLLDSVPGTCGARVLKLVPKAEAESSEDEPSTQPFREIRLYLRAEDYLPCEIRAFNQDDSEVTITIVGYKLNEPDAAAAVTFTVPEGTSLIVNEDLQEVVGAGGKTLPETNTPPAAKPADK